MSYLVDEDVYRRFVKQNYVLSLIHCYGISVYIVCFFVTVNSSVNAARSCCWRKFHGKGIKLKTFPHGYVISLCGVVVRCSRVGPTRAGFESYSTLFFLLSSFCVVVFYKYVRK